MEAYCDISIYLYSSSLHQLTLSTITLVTPYFKLVTPHNIQTWIKNRADLHMHFIYTQDIYNVTCTQVLISLPPNDGREGCFKHCTLKCTPSPMLCTFTEANSPSHPSVLHPWIWFSAFTIPHQHSIHDREDLIGENKVQLCLINTTLFSPLTHSLPPLPSPPLQSGKSHYGSLYISHTCTSLYKYTALMHKTSKLTQACSTLHNLGG